MGKQNPKKSLLLLLVFVVLLFAGIFLNVAHASTGGVSTFTCAPIVTIIGSFGICYGYATTTVITYYNGVAGQGELQPLTLSQESLFTHPTPPTSVIRQYNTNNNPWLITCPTAPQTNNGIEYFTTDPKSYIAGNRCLASLAPLLTEVSTSIFVYIAGQLNVSPDFLSLSSTGIPALISIKLMPAYANFNGWDVTHPSQGKLSNIAFSGQSLLEGKKNYNISGSYSTNSYIYGSPEPSVQQGIWSWNEEFANFNDNLNPADLKISGTQSGLTVGELNVAPMLYYPFVNIWLCTYYYTYKVTSTTNYFKNANAPIPNNGMYNGVEPGTQPSTTANIPDGYNNSYWIQYNAPVSLMWANTMLVPWLLNKIEMPAAYSNLNFKTSVLKASLDLYSPHNFITGNAYLDSYPLYSTSMLLAWGPKDYLTEYPANALTLYPTVANSPASMNPNSLLPANSLNKFLSDIYVNTPQPPNEPDFYGKHALTQILKPTFAYATPSGYVFTVDYKSQHGGFLWLYKSTRSNLTIFKTIPVGEFDVSWLQPNRISWSIYVANQPGVNSDDKKFQQLVLDNWMNAWKSNWTKIMVNQTGNLYAVGRIRLAQSKSWLGIWSTFSNKGKFDFQPKAITSDYSGDIFFAGKKGFIFSRPRLKLAFLTSDLQSGSSQPIKGMSATSEIAVSPGGQFVYVGEVAGTTSSSNSGNIEIFQVNMKNKAKPFSLVGNIPLSYSNYLYNTITYTYLLNNGPYNDPAVGLAYGSTLPSDHNFLIDKTMIDQNSDHRPLFITDSQGVLYVMDFWSSPPGGAILPNGKHYNFAMLVLRAFTENGIEIPIQPQTGKNVSDIKLSDSVLSTNGQVQFPTVGGQTAYPPYGWVLSANIELPGSSSYESYCIAGCTYTPNTLQSNNMANGYVPLLPPIADSWDFYYNSGLAAWGFDPTVANIVQGISNYQNELYIVSSDTVNSGGGGGGGCGLCLSGASPAVSGRASPALMTSTNSKGTAGVNGSTNPALAVPESTGSASYQEIAVIQLGSENYTSESPMTNMRYACYLDTNQYPDSPCVNAGSGDLKTALDNIQFPLVGVPDAMGHIGNQGAPGVLLSLTTGAGAAAPIPTDKYNKQASTAANTGCTSNGGQCTNDLGVFGSTTGTPPNGGTVPREYIKSSIGGYYLIPINSSFTLSQSWQKTSHKSLGIIGGAGTCGYIFPETGSPYPYDYNKTGFLYWFLQSKVSPQVLTESIEGGPTYLNYLSSASQYYVPDISDSNLILLPKYENRILSNRLFGEIYVNRSVLPCPSETGSGGIGGFGGLGGSCPAAGTTQGTTQLQTQLVVNQSNAYYYKVNEYHQVSVLSATANAYQDEVALIQNPVVTDPTKTGAATALTDNYYYNLGTFGGLSAGFGGGTITQLQKHSILYNNGSVDGKAMTFPQVFNVFYKQEYQYNLTLNLSQNQYGVLGYNRFVYVFVDRFNNTIYMPLDVNLANITAITIHNSTVVDPSNPNQTVVTLTGVAGYYSNFLSNQISAVPDGSSIYLYYGDNINFYDPGNTIGSTQHAEYIQDCEFANTVLNPHCLLANPVANVPNIAFYSPEYANAITFNSPNGGTCAKPPNSLLSSDYANSLYECNIYGDFGKPKTGTDPSGELQYCVPNFLNGTGTLTSQYGLIKIATTTSGQFNAKFTVCGMGTAKVLAEYYGWPPPQPRTFTQSPIGMAALQGSAVPASDMKPYYEYSYSYSPNATATSFPIGAFMLSFGDLEVPIAITIIIGIVAATIVYRRANRRSGYAMRRRAKR